MPNVPTEDICVVLDEALDYLSITGEISCPVQSAIQSRLRFRRELLCVLKLKNDLPTAVMEISGRVWPMLEEIKTTSDLGKPLNHCFSTRVQRTLASNYPPRPMVTVDFFDAVSFMETLCKDIDDIGQLSKIRCGEDFFTCISVFMTRTPKPSVYIRAVVQSFLIERRTGLVLGGQTFKCFLLSSVEMLSLPGGFLLHANCAPRDTSVDQDNLNQILTEFSEKAAPHYLDAFRILCSNRSRTRRSLCHLISQLDNVQTDAEELDDRLHALAKESPILYGLEHRSFSYPLSSWVHHRKLVHVHQILQLGFELNIYAPDELPGMYWHLTYICGIHLALLKRIRFFLEQDMHARLQPSARSDSPSRLLSEERESFERAFDYLGHVYTILQANEALSRALHALYILLFRNKGITVRERPYSSERLRYLLRMKPFLPLGVPESVAFEEFKQESSLVDLNNEEILVECHTKATHARKLWEQVLEHGWSTHAGDDKSVSQIEQRQIEKRPPRKSVPSIDDEWTKGIKNVVRACIATSVSAVALKKMTTRRDANSISVHIPIAGEKDCWHDWWIVPKISDPS